MLISAQVTTKISNTMNRKPNITYNCNTNIFHIVQPQRAILVAIEVINTWCSHRADIMKNSSMHTAPKGSTPPRATLNMGWVYHTWSGMCLFNDIYKYHASIIASYILSSQLPTC